MSRPGKGDKVRIRSGHFNGERGILVRPHLNGWIVELANEKTTITVPTEDLTNYSQAARKAWQSMPNRKVGRPTGSRVSDRMSVIFRVDKSLWKDFVIAEEAGLIADRTTVINECLRKVVEAAKRMRCRAS